MIRSFRQYLRHRGLWEDDTSMGVGPSVGSNYPSGGGDVHAAAREIFSLLEKGVEGHEGPRVLTGIVNAVLADPSVPEHVKQSVRNAVNQKWSHMVDLSNSPPGQGPGLGNRSGFGNDVVVPPMADMRQV